MDAAVEGTIASSEGGKVVLKVAGSNYELHLTSDEQWPAGQRVRGIVAAQARKVWTIPAGGSFISPLTGTPRVIQGTIKQVEGNRMFVHAGPVVCVEIPKDNNALDLKNGLLVPGVMVNITAQPGASFKKI